MRRGCSERRMKMATAGRRSTRRLLLVIIVVVTFGRIAEAYDYTKSRQFLRNIAVSKHRDNTFWIPGFRWTQPKRSLEPKKKPRWESNSSEGGKRDETASAQKSEWEKQMEEISRKERKKWKKYSTTTEIAETLTSDDRMFEELTGLKEEERVARDEDISSVRDGLENGRWGMTQRSPNTNRPRTRNDDATRSNESTTTSSSRDHRFAPGESSNGRWGMSEIEPPLEFLEESARKDETEKRAKKPKSMPKLSRISTIRAIVFGKNFATESAKDYREERDLFDWARYLNYTIEHSRAGKNATRSNAVEEPRRKGSWDVARISIETYRLPRDEPL